MSLRKFKAGVLLQIRGRLTLLFKGERRRKWFDAAILDKVSLRFMIQGLSATSFFGFWGLGLRFWVLGYGGVAFHLSSTILGHQGLFSRGV